MSADSQKDGSIAVNQFYDFITSQMPPDQALKLLLKSSLLSYDKLKFSSDHEAVHPLHIVAMAAYDMGWSIVLDKKSEDVEGLIIGTIDFVNKQLKAS